MVNNEISKLTSSLCPHNFTWFVMLNRALIVHNLNLFRIYLNETYGVLFYIVNSINVKDYVWISSDGYGFSLSYDPTELS